MRFAKMARRCALVSLILLASLCCGPKARAQVDWLVLVVDRSGSISQQQLALQRTAHASVLSDPEVVAMLGAAQVAIVEFDSEPEVVVDWSKPEIAAATYRAAGMAPIPGFTGIGNAFTAALGLLEGKRGRRIIDISANGRENVDSVALKRARATAARRSIEVNGLLFVSRSNPSLPAYFREHVVNGFLVLVEREEDFLAALRAKLALEIASADRFPAATPQHLAAPLPGVSRRAISGRIPGSAGCGDGAQDGRGDLGARIQDRALLVGGGAALCGR